MGTLIFVAFLSKYVIGGGNPYAPTFTSDEEACFQCKEVKTACEKGKKLKGDLAKGVGHFTLYQCWNKNCYSRVCRGVHTMTEEKYCWYLLKESVVTSIHQKCVYE